MFVPFDTLPDTSRIWIYQSNRKFSVAESDFIQKKLEAFCEQWAAHGTPIKSSIKIFYNQFMVLSADESFATASGCSIDSTVRLFQALESQLDCSLLNRTEIAFLVDGIVKLFPQKNLKEIFASGILNKSSLAFNNVVATKVDLTNNWVVPVEESWIKRYLPKDVVAS